MWRVDCPACGDAKRHLYITHNPEKFLLDCKKGCAFNDILRAAGLKPGDCFADSKASGKTSRQLLREHFYTDISGNILAKKQIYDTGDGGKTGIWYRLEKGQYIKGLSGVKMPLYHLDRLVKSNNTAVIVEGEKDVETVERLGFVATTSPNGAGAKWRNEWNEFFRGKNVVIITDNDEPGEKYGMSAAQSVISTAAAVKLIRSADIYSGVKAKGDISDIAAEIGDAETKKRLAEAVKAAALFDGKAKSPAPVTEVITTQSEPDSDLMEVIKQLAPQKHYGFNDRGNGEMFAAVFGRTAKYNATSKEWCIFRDGYWQTDTGGMLVNGLAKELFDALDKYTSSCLTGEEQTSYRAHVKKLGRLNVRETMIKDARDRCFIKSEDFDRDPWLFNCRNGTYDLRRDKFKSHDPADLMSKMSNVIYDAKAESPEFEKFMREIMSDDKDKLLYLMKALGYSLTGDTSLECFFILYGETSRNGKGTLMETISYMLGGEAGYAMASPPELLQRRKYKDSRTASGDIARLKGARFLNVSEPEKGMVFDAALLKTMTGRDTITARHLNEREFQFIPEFKLFINTNHLPHMTDDTVFASGRAVVIPFNRHFEDDERDLALKDKLRSPGNISGIFNLCLEGLRTFKAVGLKKCLSISEATENYRQQSDRQKSFLSECLEEDRLGNVTVKDVYGVYLRWCKENNYHPENKSNFISGLKGKNMVTDHATVNGRTAFNVVCGYRIADEYLNFCENDGREQQNPPF